MQLQTVRGLYNINYNKLLIPGIKSLINFITDKNITVDTDCYFMISQFIDYKNIKSFYDILYTKNANNMKLITFPNINRLPKIYDTNVQKLIKSIEIVSFLGTSDKTFIQNVIDKQTDLYIEYCESELNIVEFLKVYDNDNLPKQKNSQKNDHISNIISNIYESIKDIYIDNYTNYWRRLLNYTNHKYHLYSTDMSIFTDNNIIKYINNEDFNINKLNHIFKNNVKYFFYNNITDKYDDKMSFYINMIEIKNLIYELNYHNYENDGNGKDIKLISFSTIFKENKYYEKYLKYKNKYILMKK